MEDLSQAVHEYLQNGDSQLLLVGISEHINAGHAGGVASLLLLQQHSDVVKSLGWDLLSLLTPHLSPPSPHHPSPEWQLISAISETCSPKEMCLAFLEQMELVSTSCPSIFFHLLPPLHAVFQRLGDFDGRRQVSSLRSVRSMLGRVYPNLGREQGGQPAAIGREQPGGDMAPLLAAGYVVDLVEPCVAHIHQEFTRDMAPLQTFWTSLQRECVGLLLTLLGDPVVSYNLQPKRLDSESKRAVEAIMSSVVQCHCGCLQLLEYEGDSHWRSDEEDPSFGIPLAGVACFVYLVMVEAVEASYLPSPLHPHYLLHTSLIHTLTLLHRQDRHSILKGLALLEAALHRVSPHSLPHHTLEDDRYLKTGQCLVDVMVTCPHKDPRQKSVVVLSELIQRFPASCRHRLYRSLLHTSSHAGVQGLLIHSIKNEIDQALKVNFSSPFLGSDLVPLLDMILTFSPHQELLRETDRVMGGLNFLRYLLIRDKRTDDKTGVWKMCDRVRSEFIQPLRHSLESTKLQCRGERERQTGGGHGDVRGEGGPDVSVEVVGEELPDIAGEDQRKMLQLAEHQLDMMECVLVRVEELLDST